MPVVVCPKCERRLHLPESAIGGEARCPVCATVFPAEPEGGMARPVGETVHVPDPTAPWRPGGPRRAEPSPRRAADRPRDPEGASEKPRLDAAGAWLLGLAVAGLVWNTSCGCGGILTAVNDSERDEGVGLVFLAVHGGHLISLLVMLFGAQAMRQARSPGLCWAGVYFAFGEAFFVLFGIGVLASQGSRGGDFEIALLLVGVWMLLSMATVGVAFWSAGVLSREGVKALLDRDRDARQD